MMLLMLVHWLILMTITRNANYFNHIRLQLKIQTILLCDVVVAENIWDGMLFRKISVP